MPIPTVVTSDYEDENEEINDPESVEDLESISRRAIKKYPSLWGGVVSEPLLHIIMQN